MGSVFIYHNLKGGGAALPGRAEMPGFFHAMIREVKSTLAEDQKVSDQHEQGR